MQDIGAVDDLERVANIVVGDQHADAAVLQMPHQIADFAHRDGIDAGQGFVQQDVGRMGRQGAGDFHPAALAARQRDRRRVADMGDAELGQQRLDRGFQPRRIGLRSVRRWRGYSVRRSGRGRSRPLAADSRCPSARGGTWAAGDIMAVHLDRAGVGRDQAGDHVEAGGLAGAVGAQKARPLRRAARDRLTERTTGRLLKLLPMRVTTRPLPPSTTRGTAMPGFRRRFRAGSGLLFKAHAKIMPVCA